MNLRYICSHAILIDLFCLVCEFNFNLFVSSKGQIKKKPWIHIYIWIELKNSLKSLLRGTQAQDIQSYQARIQLEYILTWPE